eukprot:5542587-Prymnesium_polylepis.1
MCFRRALRTRISSSLVVKFVDCTVRRPWVRIPAGRFLRRALHGRVVVELQRPHLKAGSFAVM